MTSPDFFIVGAPRCGTTSLIHYLSGHPSVCFADPKETHYFTGMVVDEPLARLEEQYQQYQPSTNVHYGFFQSLPTNHTLAECLIQRVHSILLMVEGYERW